MKFPATPAAIDALIKKYEGLVEEVDDSLLELAVSSRLPMPGMPDDVEELVEFTDAGMPLAPEDITKVTDEDTGKLFSFFSGWTSYVQSEVAYAQVEKMMTKRTERIVKAALSEYYKDVEKLPANQAAEKVLLDSRYLEIDMQTARVEARHVLLEAAYEQLRRVINVVSREQTRRKEELERVRHNPDREGDGSRPRIRLRSERG